MDEQTLINYLEEIIKLETTKYKLTNLKNVITNILEEELKVIKKNEETKIKSITRKEKAKYETISNNHDEKYTKLNEYIKTKDNLICKIKKLKQILDNKPKYKEYYDKEFINYELSLENYLDTISEVEKHEKTVLAINESIDNLNEKKQMDLMIVKKEQKQIKDNLEKELSLIKTITDYQELILDRIKKTSIIHINKQLKSINTKLTNKYNKNIIFPKYSFFHAIINIYEYFITNRCHELGTAYNIYENEDIKFIQLNEETFKNIGRYRNQYYVCETIKEINQYTSNNKTLFEELIKKSISSTDINILNKISNNIHEDIENFLQKISK